MADGIGRTLACKDREGRQQVIGEAEIPTFREPVIILGDPGMGKSVLCRSLDVLPRMKRVEAAALVRDRDPESLIGERTRIVVDGIDELASSSGDRPLDAVLRQLRQMGDPQFVLSCRAADWRGASDCARIRDESIGDPAVLRLQPFGPDDVRAFLSAAYEEIDADRVLGHLRDKGIEEIGRNPLGLRLLAEVAQATGHLPEGRGDLLDRACRCRLRETSGAGGGLPCGDAEELLLSAGALCAMQLLCGLSGVHTGSPAETPAGFLNAGDVDGLPMAGAAADVLRTGLFRTEGGERFVPEHRTIAEYLGAKWLAWCADAGVSVDGIFALFDSGGGVPAWLRGLHAWTAQFSPALTGRCIAADPYAVLHYCDAGTFDPEHARAMLAELAKAGDAVSSFAGEDRGCHRASGLMRSELREDIAAAIGARGGHVAFLVEAMAETPLAGELSGELHAILFDRERSRAERYAAHAALERGGARNDPGEDVRRLLDMQDPDSAWLACRLLEGTGARDVAIGTCIDAVLAHLGLAEGPRPAAEAGDGRDLGDALFDDFDTARLESLLDGMAGAAPALMSGAPAPRARPRSSRSSSRPTCRARRRCWPSRSPSSGTSG